MLLPWPGAGREVKGDGGFNRARLVRWGGKTLRRVGAASDRKRKNRYSGRKR